MTVKEAADRLGVKPCPFCGAGRFTVSPSGLYVCCSGCGATGPAAEFRFGTPGAALVAQAVAGWNRRVVTDGDKTQ